MNFPRKTESRST